MNSTRRKIAKRKARAERRLKQRNDRDRGRPLLEAAGIRYDVSERVNGIAAGGIGAVALVARSAKLAKEIDDRVQVLTYHKPYHESDHVLSVAMNVVAGGTCIEDLELRRNDPAFLDALGTPMVLDPTTAGDFCRRFDESSIDHLQTAINEARLRVWARQPKGFLDEATIDVDGSLVLTGGECKEGADFTYKGDFGYHPLVTSLANTDEVLSIVNRSGNRPSHEGAAAEIDKAIELVRRAGARKILARGDTDFSQTQHLDRWDTDGIRFIFGYDARKNLVELAESQPDPSWTTLRRKPKYVVTSETRTRRRRVKEGIVRDREYLNYHLLQEEIAEIEYQPGACSKPYRMVMLKKTISVERGQRVIQPDVKYFFYITNVRDLSAAEIVFSANDRCRQEKVIGQLKSINALHAPLDSLESNWAYMVMATLGWNLKAWFGLLLPVAGRWKEKHLAEKREVMKMQFKRFQTSFIQIATQIVRTARRVIFRVIGYNPYAATLVRLADSLVQQT